jgi:hypothetical protein
MNGNKLVKTKQNSNLLNLFYKNGFRKKIKNKIKKKYIGDYSDKELYKIYVLKWFNTLNINISFEEKLYNVGFTKTNSKLYYNLIKPLLDNSSYSESQIFDIIIEYGLGKYKPLKPDARFLFNKNVDEWIFEPSIKSLIFNMSENFEDTNEMIRSLPNHKNTNILCFHTTNWRSFVSIEKYGILPSKNRECLDFGITRSFYTNINYNLSEEYANTKSKYTGNELCTIVFSIPEQKLNKFFKIKKFNTNTKEWIELTKSSRICEDEENELDNYDIIYGPMVSNPIKVSNKLEDPCVHNQIKYQYAFKKEIACNFLRKHLIGTIFYDKYYYLNKN